jgi:hypothetical protein
MKHGDSNYKLIKKGNYLYLNVDDQPVIWIHKDGSIRIKEYMHNMNLGEIIKHPTDTSLTIDVGAFREVFG